MVGKSRGDFYIIYFIVSPNLSKRYSLVLKVNKQIDYKKEEEFLEKFKEMVISLLKGKRCKVYLFGSRARGDFKRHSDVDIAVSGLSEKEFRKFRWQLEDKLEESIVPFEADILNFDLLPEEMKEIIKKEGIRWL